MNSRRYFPTVVRATNGYPTSDHRPMAETDFHRKLMVQVIDTLIAWYQHRPDVYVTGNLLLFYEKGNKRRHVAPDCFVAFGVPNYDRPNYLLWDERQTPAVVIEITSRTTRTEDTKKKFALYRDVIRVPEYFLFDPKQEYLQPSLQGHRLTEGGEYAPIEPVARRLPSTGLGLHLERDGESLRFWNPAKRRRVPTPLEHVYSELREKEAEVERLRRELDELRDEPRRNGNGRQ